jgi:hypothetical protein
MLRRTRRITAANIFVMGALKALNLQLEPQAAIVTLRFWYDCNSSPHNSRGSDACRRCGRCAFSCAQVRSKLLQRFALRS